MNKPISPSTGTGLRQRLIEDMSERGFSKCPYENILNR
jgi:hypothetical protein